MPAFYVIQPPPPQQTQEGVEPLPEVPIGVMAMYVPEAKDPDDAIEQTLGSVTYSGTVHVINANAGKPYTIEQRSTITPAGPQPKAEA